MIGCNFYILNMNLPDATVGLHYSEIHGGILLSFLIVFIVSHQDID
jgi:hypothetical protein